MATIQDVAKAAGVSASTVSRYLNGQLHVSAATEARMLDAVRDLGYVPNAQARNLVRQSSGVVGFVVPEISNPYFGAVTDYVVEAVERRGRLVLLCSTRSQAAKEASYIDLLASGAIDGMLYLGSFRSNERLAAAIRGGLPVVVVDEPIAGLPDVHTVVMDDYAGGYQAASYLVALGHRRIAHVAGPETADTARRRRMGYSAAMSRAGLAADPRLIVHADYTPAGGRAAMDELLTAPERPTAVFVANVASAVGVLHALYSAGVSVPGDLSVIAMHDMPLADHLVPALTTVRMPLGELGARAVRMMATRGPAEPITEVVAEPVEVVIRESTAPPRGEQG